jgi:hypothetical protein
MCHLRVSPHEAHVAGAVIADGDVGALKANHGAPRLVALDLRVVPARNRNVTMSYNKTGARLKQRQQSCQCAKG